MTNVQLSTTQLPVLFSETERIVISTEAAHGFIVSGAAEKSASLPRLFASHHPAFAVDFGKQTSEVTDSIMVALVTIFLSLFSAQKSHVKSQNHLNPTNKTRSSWHFSYPQTAILNI
jgi:hypothetical protein